MKVSELIEYLQGEVGTWPEVADYEVYHLNDLDWPESIDVIAVLPHEKRIYI